MCMIINIIMMVVQSARSAGEMMMVVQAVRIAGCGHVYEVATWNVMYMRMSCIWGDIRGILVYMTCSYTWHWHYTWILHNSLYTWHPVMNMSMSCIYMCIWHPWNIKSSYPWHPWNPCHGFHRCHVYEDSTWNVTYMSVHVQVHAHTLYTAFHIAFTHLRVRHIWMRHCGVALADVHTLYTAFHIAFRCVTSRRCVRATHLNGTRVLSHTEVHCDSIVHAAHVMTMRQHRACNACALDVTHSSFIHVCMNESCTLYTVCTSMSHIHCILYTNHLYMTHMQWMWLTPLSYTCVWISYQHALYALRACSACNECLSCMHWCMHESALHTVLSHCNLWRMDESALHCRIVISHTYITMRQCSAWHAHIRVYYLHDIDIPRGILIYMTSCHAYEDVIYIHMCIHAWDFITCHACSALSHCTALSHSWHATV